MKNPPILIAVLGFFGALAGFGFLFFGLRALGFDWFGAFGDLPKLEHIGFWGWLAVLNGIIWLVAAFGLWGLQPWARLFAMVIAGIALFEALLAFFQFPGTGIGFGMALMPALILWYLKTAEVKEAFGLLPDSSVAEVAVAPVAAPGAAPAAPAAPAVAPAAVAFAAAGAVSSREPDAEPAVPAAPLAAAPMAAPVAAAPLTPVGLRPIEDVEGIGPEFGQKLVAAGVRTTEDLLNAGATRAGRQRLADATGISGQLILEWVNHVDLMRVPGIGPQYSDLLEAAGVDSPAELVQRNAANLATTFQEVVAARPGVVRRIPTEAEVAVWIEAARSMPRVVEH